MEIIPDCLFYIILELKVVSMEASVPIIDLTEENLERRIQRIRERDEEIEKKHREAEADRLTALKMNAMVKIKQSSDEDEWPRAHKYDKLDFTYDIDEDDSDTAQDAAKDTAKDTAQDAANDTAKDAVKITMRKPTVFAENEGPPADPIYNFLADSERDGLPSNEKREWNSATNNSHNRKNNKFAVNNSFSNRKSQSNDLHKKGGSSQADSWLRQKTDGIKLGTRRDGRDPQSEKLATLFPTASRINGPIKLIGGDYYARKSEQSESSEEIRREEKHKSHSSHSYSHSHSHTHSHSSKHRESKNVKRKFCYQFSMNYWKLYEFCYAVGPSINQPA